jgi:tRNA(Leu) C34 or U34 (ribose-2'-O)-methylase TrmL
MSLVEYASSLLQPLGFQVDDAKLKRAGLDYWPYPKVSVLFVVSSMIVFT